MAEFIVEMRSVASGNVGAVAAEGGGYRLAYGVPFDWGSSLEFLAGRAVPGVEFVSIGEDEQKDDGFYARTFSLQGEQGHFVVSKAADGDELQVDICFPDRACHAEIIRRVRGLFDLDADSAGIEAHLARDRLLRKVIARYPGLRIPGCWDGFEVAVRAVLGQQVSVKAAATLVARVAQRHGSSYSCEIPQLNRVFPAADALAGNSESGRSKSGRSSRRKNSNRSSLDGLGIVGSRVQAIQQIASGVQDGELCIERGADSARFIDAICVIKGIGEWTAEYIAMRALGDSDAFPHADLILRRAALPAVRAKQDPKAALSPKEMLVRAEGWRPWRAYAVMLLWKHYADRMQASAKQPLKKPPKQ